MVKKWKLERIAAGLPVREPESEVELVWPFELVDNNGATLERGWNFHCLGCGYTHHFRTWHVGESKPMWTFDGNKLKPSFTPSLLMFTLQHETKPDGSHGPVVPEKRITHCHVVVTKGILNYCGDNPHALNGKSVPMVPRPSLID